MINLLKDRTFQTAIVLTLLGILMSLGGNIWLKSGQIMFRQTNTTGNSNSNTVIGPIPQRIICVTPLGTELIYALGCQNTLVGVDIFSDYPAEVIEKTQVGSFFDTNFEAITALTPDLIITLGESKDIVAYCQSNNVRQLKLQMSDLAGIYDDILRVGVVLGCSDKAQVLCRELFGELAEVRHDVIARQMGEQPVPVSVFLCINRKVGTLTNLGTAGPGTCLTELIEIAGGKNIFDDLTMPYADISRESLLTRSPEVIIEAVSATLIAEKGQELRQEWQSLDVPASKNGRVYLIDENLLNRPGIRSGEIAKILYEYINEKTEVRN